MNGRATFVVAAMSLVVATAALSAALFVWLAPADAIGNDMAEAAQREIAQDVTSSGRPARSDAGTIRWAIARSQTNVDARIAAVESSVSDAVRTLNALRMEPSEDDDFDTRIRGLRDDLQFLESALDGLRSDVETAQEGVDELVDRADDLESTAASIDSKVENVCFNAGLHSTDEGPWWGLASDIEVAC